MISIEQFEALADSVARDLPRELFRRLNGGILILPNAKYHEKSRPECPLCILGEYSISGGMGRFINIYYGSFMRLFASLDEEQLREKLRSVIAHEFRHHMESLSGENTLEIEDMRRLSQYIAGANNYTERN